MKRFRIITDRHGITHLQARRPFLWFFFWRPLWTDLATGLDHDRLTRYCAMMEADA